MPNPEPKPYKPTEHDIAWTKSLMRKLNVGGIWFYETHNVQVQKRDENTLVLMAGDEHVFMIYVFVHQLKDVLKSCDINLVDQRPEKEKL